MADWKDIELEGLVLHSGRLTLRPWQPDDAAPVQQIMTDERMATYLPLPCPIPPPTPTDFVTGAGQEGRRTGTRLDCAIAENTTGRLVGSASLRLPVSRHDSAEIGYWLGTAEWGNGYATEAVRTLARFGLGNGLARIEIRCEVPNAASAAVALRAGFRFEAVRRARCRAGTARSTPRSSPAPPPTRTSRYHRRGRPWPPSATGWWPCARPGPRTGRCCWPRPTTTPRGSGVSAASR